MQFRFVYLALGASVCTLLMMCQPDPNLNQFVSVPFPLDNPSDSAKIALGKKLFFDTRLSLDNTVSCATCHKPGKAFTD